METAVFIVGALGGLVVLFAVVAVIGALVDRGRERATERTRAQWGDKLARWQGLDGPERLAQSDPSWWRKGLRAGLTEAQAQAQAWSDAGLPVALAALAAVRRVGLAKVRALAAVMRETGAWNGTDQGALTLLLGWHVELGCPTHEVLRDWLRPPLAEVRELVRVSVADPSRRHRRRVRPQRASQLWPGGPQPSREVAPQRPPAVSRSRSAVISTSR